MTDIIDTTHALDVPDLTPIKETDSFKQTYGEHTASQLRTALDDLGVAHLASDDKSDLTWRYMDAMNVAFKNDAEPVAEVDQLITDPAALVPPEAPTEAPANPDNSIHVHNTGAFNVLETATMTLMKAKEITTITPTVNATSERILSNIAQMNRTRGNELKVL